MSLSDIVNVTITAQTQGVSRQGFGTPLLCGYHTVWTNERVREYSSLASMVSDGFATTDPLYRMAQAVFSQTPRVPSIKIGRRALAPTEIIHLTPTVVNSATYTFSIKGPGAQSGEEFSFTADSSATAQEIVEGLVADMGSATIDVTPTEDNAKVILTGDAAGKLFEVYDLTSNLSMRRATTDPGIATDLAAIQLEDDDWYCLLIDSNSEAEINAAAAWIETQSKIFIASSSDLTILDSGVTTDVASDLEAAAYDRTALIYHAKDFEYPACAWAGRLLPFDPGSASWAYKTLSGVTRDALPDADQTDIENKTANYYVTIGGVNITLTGKMASGEWIDIMQSIDWLTARIRERVFALLVNNNKIPYTDVGISMIRAEVFAQLQQGISRGVLAADPEPVVTVPRAADVESADKNDRILRDVFFQATLAGAIHKAVIQGTLSV